MLYQSPDDIIQSVRSKTRTAKGILACKRRRRTLSFKNRAGKAAEQRESHHGDLHGCSTSMYESQTINRSDPQARTSIVSRGHHTHRLAPEPCRSMTSHVQCLSTTSTSSCKISSSGWTVILCRSAIHTSATVAAHAGSSSSPMGSRRHGRRRRRNTVQEKLEPSLNFYVTVMKRSDDTEPVQITLDPVFDVESDGDLENGWSLRRFRAMLIRNFQSHGGSTAVKP